MYCFLEKHWKMNIQGGLSSADLENFWIAAWPDADFCGDIYTARSTSGFHLEIRTNARRCFPLSWGSKNVTCIPSRG